MSAIIAKSTAPEAIVVARATAPEPSKLTALAVSSPVKEKFCAEAKAVAVAALPVVEPDEPETLPVTLPVRLPSKVPATSVSEPTVHLSADSS